MRNVIHPFVPILLLAALATPAEAQEEPARPQIGVAFVGGVTAAPLGGLAESCGLFAVPGMEFGARLVTRSVPGAEWSLGFLTDRFRIEHDLTGDGRAAFTYDSHAAVGGRSWSDREGDVPVRYGVELGWRRYLASSTRPNAYTGELESSRTRGDVALLAVSFGVELPSNTFALLPTLRVETNYPDFGGGDGFSRLHRSKDLGFRASFAIQARVAASR